MTNVIMINVNKTNADDAQSELIGGITEYLEQHIPSVSIENDGIGNFEYWGIKGIDKGIDYVLVESTGPYTFGVDLTDCSIDYVENLLDGAESIEHECIINHEIMIEHFSVNLSFIVLAVKAKNKTLLIIGQWVDSIK